MEGVQGKSNGDRLGLDMVSAVAVLKEQAGSVKDQGLHRNFLFRGQFFQFPAQLGRDVHLNVHAVNGIAAPGGVRTAQVLQHRQAAGSALLRGPDSGAVRLPAGPARGGARRPVQE